ncbi:hypothetical protein JOF45_001946 [Nesterenkonia lacusekhoensis]|uniref:Uncharacterized protein n=1 Tax=Nesterenkonia lacusekhoensis TaxID=150832 RepID=A0ABS4T396_9MICC|nr:hypothetical protein [Nesterenkonia lacusekhoensis]
MTDTAPEVVGEEHSLRMRTRSGELEIRGNEVRLPDPHQDPVRLAPGPLALMRVLVKAQGAVLSLDHLLGRVSYICSPVIPAESTVQSLCDDRLVLASDGSAARLTRPEDSRRRR